MATKSKKVSVSKTELEETAVGVEALAESRMEDGLIEVSAGAQNVGGSQEGPPGRPGGANRRGGRRDARRGPDGRRGQTGQAERSRGRGRRVGRGRRHRGVGDVGGHSRAVRGGFFVQHGRRAGARDGAWRSRRAVARRRDIVAAREMPVLAAFLEDKGNLLRVFAVDSIKRAGRRSGAGAGDGRDGRAGSATWAPTKWPRG